MLVLFVVYQINLCEARLGPDGTTLKQNIQTKHAGLIVYGKQ